MTYRLPYLGLAVAGLALLVGMPARSDAAPVSIITSLSIPSPTPPVGGIPQPTAFTKSQSTGTPVCVLACASKRSACSTGSVSSV